MRLPRSSGILLHITSLPSPFGIGDFGPAAYAFADLLHEANQSVWQVLPLVPTGFGHSPYASPSTFAGNPALISPEILLKDGLLLPEDIDQLPEFDDQRVAFDEVLPFKYDLLKKAYLRFEQKSNRKEVLDFASYCKKNSSWLDDYALFAVLKITSGDKEWIDWEPSIKNRTSKGLAAMKEAHATEISMHKFWQFLFHKQWQALKTYCNEKGIKIFGDLPIYVAHDSSDVWANQSLFHLDKDGRQIVVAGVPPDYFSETGQRWGNPIYRWDIMAAKNFDWWTHRFQSILGQVDYVRLDHFRGFEAYWAVPASEKTAINGTWIDGPKHSLFEVLEKRLGTLPVIAENLGVITDEVTSIMETFEFPGMAILEFAFDGDASSEFLPHNYKEDLVAYTGTHDNDTLLGWWYNNSSTQDIETKEQAHEFATDYLGLHNIPEEELHWAFIRALFGSVARLAIVPLQDVMGLDASGRMNTPGTVGNENWSWRFTFNMIPKGAFDQLARLTEIYGR